MGWVVDGSHRAGGDGRCGSGKPPVGLEWWSVAEADEKVGVPTRKCGGWVKIRDKAPIGRILGSGGRVG